MHSIVLATTVERVAGVAPQRYRRGREPAGELPDHPVGVREAARLKGVTRAAIFTALKDGRLQGERDGHGRWRIPPKILAAYRPQ